MNETPEPTRIICPDCFGDDVEIIYQNQPFTLISGGNYTESRYECNECGCDWTEEAYPPVATD